MKYFSTHGLYIMLIFMLCSLTGGAQIINKPVPADNPNYAGHSVWGAACASEDFREYFVNITWSPPVVNSDNEFILELSDANGDFSNPTTLATINDKNSDFDFDVGFEVPEDARGENYTMRVRSTSPAITGPASDPYPIYFIGYKNPILISRDASGTIPPGGEISVCNGESIVLATHNVPNQENYEYLWYKDDVIVSERNSEITITEEGVYYVEIDYGESCSGSANTRSNYISVIYVDPLNISISAQSSTSICNGQTVNLETNVNDANLTYTWYKDDVAITPPTLGQYVYTVDASVTDFDGEYHVTVQGQNTCVEQSNSITVTDAGVFEVSLDQSPDIRLLPSESSTISVTTTGTNPTFQWYRNGSQLAGETSDSLIVDEDGEYFVRVSQGGACSSSQVDSDTTTVALPDSFSFTIGFVGSYAECSSTEANITISRIDAIYGANTIDVTSTIQNDFGYQWQVDGTDVTGETTFAILLIDPTENGTYSLSGVLDSYAVSSNNLNVRIGSGESVEITSNGTAICDGDTLILETERDLSGETFEWRKDGVLFDNSNSQIEISETGGYQLVIQQNDCPLVSNTIDVLPFDDSAITIDVEPEFLFVSGTTVTVTAEGATTYEWYDENNELVGTGSAFDVTQEGTYILVASIDNCSGTRTFTAILRDEFEVPNVITPNGDGINDLWLLPNIYSGNPKIRVTIFSDTGEEIFRQENYQNNWPESSMSFPKQNMIFYYTIKELGSTVKQGTITVIR